MNKCVIVKDIKNALIELSRSGERLERVTTNNIIKAICNLQTFEMSEDCVSREEVYRAIITCGEVDNDLNHLYEVIENFPSVVPQVNKNEWVEEFSDDGWRWVKDEL